MKNYSHYTLKHYVVREAMGLVEEAGTQYIFTRFLKRLVWVKQKSDNKWKRIRFCPPFICASKHYSFIEHMDKDDITLEMLYGD